MSVINIAHNWPNNRQRGIDREKLLKLAAIKWKPKTKTKQKTIKQQTQISVDYRDKQSNKTSQVHNNKKQIYNWNHTFDKKNTKRQKKKIKPTKTNTLHLQAARSAVIPPAGRHLLPHLQWLVFTAKKTQPTVMTFCCLQHADKIKLPRY